MRIWPHRMGGEGHFLALMQRVETEPDVQQAETKRGAQQAETKRGAQQAEAKCDVRRAEMKRDARRAETKLHTQRTRAETKLHTQRTRAELHTRQMQTERHARKTGEALFAQFLDTLGIRRPEGSLDCRGDRIYLVPELPASVRGLNFIRNGVWLGELRKDRFEPAQPFAMLLRAADCDADAVVNFRADDPRLEAYLTGQTVVFSEIAPAPPAANGWKLVCVDGFGIGWARYSGGILKNKYPVSWR